MTISRKSMDVAKELFAQLDEHWEGDNPDQGMNRKGWSWEETNAMNMMSQFAEGELGMQTYEDLAGNRYLISTGHNNREARVRMLGSHLDAVQNGGRYDGQLVSLRH